jgi:Flp pilus assembly protein TadD
MAQKNERLSKANTATKGTETNGAEEHPYDVAEVLRKVERLLEEGQPENALKTISHARVQAPWVSNAIGVCLLRKGEAEEAARLFRGLTLANGGVAVRGDVPTVFATNFATALLLSNNLSGCESILHEIKDKTHPAVEQLETAIRKWRSGLSLWQKLRMFFGEAPAQNPVLDFPPGHLE